MSTETLQETRQIPRIPLSYAEPASNSQDDLFFWHELSEKERRAIPNPQDIPIIAVIDGMPRQMQELAYNAIAPPRDGSYNRLQRKWIEDEIYYLGERLGRPSSTTELLEDMKEKGTYFRYRLYWAASKWMNHEYDLFGISIGAKPESQEVLAKFFLSVARACNKDIAA